MGVVIFFMKKHKTLCGSNVSTTKGTKSDTEDYNARFECLSVAIRNRCFEQRAGTVADTAFERFGIDR